MKSNRSGIGSRVICTTADGHRQMDEVRSGGSYISQSDLRVHFGLGSATSADIEVRWPSGAVDRLRASANRVVIVTEGKIRRAYCFSAAAQYPIRPDAQVLTDS